MGVSDRLDIAHDNPIADVEFIAGGDATGGRPAGARFGAQVDEPQPVLAPLAEALPPPA